MKLSLAPEAGRRSEQKRKKKKTNFSSNTRSGAVERTQRGSGLSRAFVNGMTTSWKTLEAPGGGGGFGENLLAEAHDGVLSGNDEWLLVNVSPRSLPRPGIDCTRCAAVFPGWSALEKFFAPSQRRHSNLSQCLVRGYEFVTGSALLRILAWWERFFSFFPRRGKRC